jgi:hypothetical protein
VESTGTPDPKDAAAALDDVRLSQARLAAGLRLPSWFYGSIGLAIAVQILTAAFGLVVDSTRAHVVLVAGLLGFAAVAGIQALRFRRLNGVWVSRLVSRVVLGTAAAASVAYAAALAGALWAALGDHWWLSAVCAIAGGAGYIASGMRWMRVYRADPQANAGRESVWWMLVATALAGAGLFLLILGR